MGSPATTIIPQSRVITAHVSARREGREKGESERKEEVRIFRDSKLAKLKTTFLRRILRYPQEMVQYESEKVAKHELKRGDEKSGGGKSNRGHFARLRPVRLQVLLVGRQARRTQWSRRSQLGLRIVRSPRRSSLRKILIGIGFVDTTSEELVGYNRRLSSSKLSL